MRAPSDQDLLNVALRHDLHSFVRKTFATVSPGDRFQSNWHIEAIAYLLNRCYHGEAHRLIITQPPRSLKSICSSVAFVAWALGHDPQLRFICVSYSQDLADELSRQFRLVVESAWYRQTFPGMRLKRSSEGECITTAGGGRLATSVGGTLTGRGADIIIIDDPLKAAEAQSETARRAVIDWYRTVLVTRLNDKARGSIVLVMQRLHEEDLAGYLLEQGGWTHLDLPAIAIEDQTVALAAEVDYHRRAGELLHPERESQVELDRLRRELGSLAFSAQYQQRPVPIEGNLVKREWFRFYDTPQRDENDHLVQSWDIAGTTNAASDYSVCTTWLSRGKENFLLDLWRGRLAYPRLKRKAIELQRTTGAGTVLVEGAGLGLSLYQDLLEDSPAHFPRPIKITPCADKVTRMESQSAKIEAGGVLLPKEAPWLNSFLHEVLAFPKGRHDDQVDSLSQYLGWRREPLDEDIGMPVIVSDYDHF
ncbi:MAG: phage terminase large subunit [Rhodovibrionaceae bacterium]